MVIVSETVSDWFEKGEVVDRYYNPGELFDDVHLVLTNDDRPDEEQLQRTAGRASVHIHNVPLPKGAFRRTLGYQPRLLRRWAGDVVALAESIDADLVRCHGANVNAFAASEIRRKLGIPFVVSLHINPDEDVRGRTEDRRERLRLRALRSLERYTLRRADIVLPVYEAIVPYLRGLGVTRYRVAYNALNAAHLEQKQDYGLHEPVRVVSVGRQVPAKNPEHLIRAIVELPDVELTLVGDGSLHDHLHSVASEAGVADRVVFNPAMTNDEVCRLLPTQDIFATHTEHWEISKSVLEAFLTGLPVILNRRDGEAVPELTPEVAMLIQNTSRAYADAISELTHNAEARELLGRSAARHAHRLWAPEAAEAVFVEVYRALLDARSGSA